MQRVALSWDDLAGLALARQFPSADLDVPSAVAAIGAMQTQTARSAFLGLASRFPGTTRDEVTAAYESGAIVRGSTIRGTVHTTTPRSFADLGSATAVGQRTLWDRMLRLERSSVDDLWSATEAYASTWRTTDELQDHLQRWLVEHEGADEVTGRLGQAGRYLAFGHGGLVRRPVNGDWAGQGAPEYAHLPGVGTIEAAIELHLRCHGPASRHDLAWWSGMGLRVVDEVLAAIDTRVGLTTADGPDDRTYVDLPDAAAPRAVDGVRLLPEFDALMCAYDPAGRLRFAEAAHLVRLWSGANGLVLPPLLVDGRITGYWRAAGSSRRRPLEVTWFARTRRPRKDELDEPVAALEAGLGITVSSVTITRELV